MTDETTKDETPATPATTTPAPASATPEPEPFNLASLSTELLPYVARVLTWLQRDVHPLWGGRGTTFDAEDTAYWLGRFVAVWHDTKQANAETRFLMVQQTLLREFRTYGKPGQFRKRQAREIPSAALDAPTRTAGVRGVLRIAPPRAFADDDGPQMICGLDDLKLLALWLRDPAAAQARIQQHVLYGYGWIHAHTHNWTHFGLSKNTPGHLNGIAELTKFAAKAGARMHWSLAGSREGGLEKLPVLSQYVRELGRVVNDEAVRPGVGLLQIVTQRQNLSDGELQDLAGELRSAAPTALIALTEPDTFAHAAHVAREGDVLVPSLDAAVWLAEGIDRPWRQPWEWAQFRGPWIARGTGGPGLVGEASTPEVYRSHRLMAFLAGAAVSIYQSKAGSELGDFKESPAYARCGSMAVLPQNPAIVPRDLVNGPLPEHPFLALSRDQVRLQSRTGALGLYAREGAKDTRVYHLLPGMVTDVVLNVLRAGTYEVWDPTTWQLIEGGELKPDTQLRVPLSKTTVNIDRWIITTGE